MTEKEVSFSKVITVPISHRVNLHCEDDVCELINDNIELHGSPDAMSFEREGVNKILKFKYKKTT